MCLCVCVSCAISDEPNETSTSKNSDLVILSFVCSKHLLCLASRRFCLEKVQKSDDGGLFDSRLMAVALISAGISIILTFCF